MGNDRYLAHSRHPCVLGRMKFPWGFGVQTEDMLDAATRLPSRRNGLLIAKPTTGRRRRRHLGLTRPQRQRATRRFDNCRSHRGVGCRSGNGRHDLAHRAPIWSSNHPQPCARRIVCMNNASWGLASCPTAMRRRSASRIAGDVDRDALAVWVDLRSRKPGRRRGNSSQGPVSSATTVAPSMASPRGATSRSRRNPAKTRAKEQSSNGCAGEIELGSAVEADRRGSRPAQRC